MSNPSDSGPAVKQKSPRKKPERFVRLVRPFDAEGKNAEIVITMARGKKVEEFRYWADRIPSDWGTAFVLEKQGDGTQENEEYHVCLDPQDGDRCDCKGFSRWGHCKHIACLRKLQELGAI